MTVNSILTEIKYQIKHKSLIKIVNAECANCNYKLTKNGIDFSFNRYT